MSKTVKQNDRAQGVAEARPPSAAPSPGGPQRERATFASPGDAGVGMSDHPPGCACSGEDCDYGSALPIGGTIVSGTEGHEIYCGCPDCGPSDDSCAGCGETCDKEFCFCVEDCTVCPDVAEAKDLGLEQFTFTCTPDTIPPGDYQDCWNPDTYMAFWDEGELVVVDTQSDQRWEVISYEPQIRPASRQYYTWYCARRGATDPCTEDFMRSISS